MRPPLSIFFSGLNKPRDFLLFPYILSSRPFTIFLLRLYHRESYVVLEMGLYQQEQNGITPSLTHLKVLCLMHPKVQLALLSEHTSDSYSSCHQQTPLDFFPQSYSPVSFLILFWTIFDKCWSLSVKGRSF